jgi:hypothetical protein
VRPSRYQNEITQVGALFDGVDLAGVVVTGEAAHPQHATARYLVEQKHCDCLLQVKGNQPGLLAEVLAARALDGVVMDAWCPLPRVQAFRR